MVKKIFGQIYIWLILIFMYLPVMVLVAYSFTDAGTVIGTWGKSTNGNLYVSLFQRTDIMIALGNTVIIAITSALVSVVLGTIGAIGAFYSKRRTRKTIDAFTQIPIVNAEIVMALSLTVMFVFLQTYIFRTNLFSFWTLLIGHVTLSLPFVYISVKPKLEMMDPSLYEAAIDLGAKPNQALRKVVLPEILPGIFSGFLLAVTLSLDDFVITRFTTGAGLLSGDSSIQTISTYVQGVIKKSSIPDELKALTGLLVLAVFLVVIIISVRRWYKSKHVVTHSMKRSKYVQ